MSGSDDFWSRRKASVAAEAEAEQAARRQEDETRDRVAREDRPDEDILAELDLPDPDTLNAGDDFSAFLKQAVPERLRRRALRRLWLSNPTLANLDNLVDYGEDYTDAATVVENLSTTYQVGKGMLQHVLANREPDVDRPEDDGQGAAPAVSELTEEMPEDSHAVDGIAKAAPAPTPSPAWSEPEQPQPAPRRMRFDFDNDETTRHVT